MGNQLTAYQMEITLKAIADAVVWLGKNHTIQWCNSAFGRLVNQPTDIIINSQLPSLLPLNQGGKAIAAKSYPHIRLQQGNYQITEYEIPGQKSTLIVEISAQQIELDNEISTLLIIRDITALKQVTAVQQQSEKEVLSVLRATLESTADGILVMNRNLDILVMNQKFMQMCSVPKQQRWLNSSQERLQFLAQQTVDPQGLITRMRELVNQRPEDTVLDIIEMQDGRIFELYSQPLKTDNQIHGRVWSFRDITQQKRTEKELRFAQYSLEHISDNVACCDAEGRILYVNQASCRMMGYTPEQFLSMKVYDIDPNYTMAGWQEHWQELKANGSLTFETTVRSQSGKLIPVEVTATYLEFAGVGYNFSVSRDISERKQTEKALQSLVATTASATGAEFFASTVRHLAHLFNVRYAVIAEKVDGKLETARTLSFWAGNSLGENFEYSTNGIPCDIVLKQGNCYFPEKIQQIFPQEPIFQELGIQAYQGVSLINSAGETIGLVAILDVKPLPPEKPRSAILQIFAARIASEIERLQAETALRRSEAQFRALFETTNMAVMIADEGGIVCNTATEKLFGYSKQEFLSLNAAKMSPPFQPNGRSSDEYSREQIAKAYEKGNHRFEWVHRRADGSDFLAEVLLTGVQVDNSLFLQALVQDLTERKQAEEALRLIVEGTAAKTGEEFFESCVRYLVQVLRVRYALLTEVANENQTRVRTLAFCGGSDPEDFQCQLDPEYDLYDTPCGTVFKDRMRYYPANLQSLFPNDYHLVALNAESYLGMLLTDSAGNTLGHLAVMDVKPMESDPGRELILKIFASRAGAELERKQAEEKFVKAFRASPNPIAITSLSENRFIDVNSSFLKMCGYALEEVIGHTSVELKLGVAEETYAKAIAQALETGSLHNLEFKLRTQSGIIKTVLLSIELIDLAGCPCVLNIINDITERKRLENELISLVSHELRTPMTSLLGALDLLGSGQLGTLSPQGEQVLNIAINNTERLTRLVNDILDLERMKSGKVVMQKANCNVADLLTQAVQAMAAMADKSEIKLILEPINLDIFVDSDRILQTLTNLLSNAIKFSHPGGKIWLRAHKQAEKIEIQVQDEGRGIPTDKLQSIFDRFQQVDASDSRKKGGTGLGLAICKNIVEQHEGKIWVESVLGKGSIFYISLPLISSAINL
jgi:PAS domain S-box-containing protein